MVEYSATTPDARRLVPDVELDGGVNWDRAVFEVKAENGVSTRDELILINVGRTVSGPTRDADTLEETVAFQAGTDSVAEGGLLEVVKVEEDPELELENEGRTVNKGGLEETAALSGEEGGTIGGSFATDAVLGNETGPGMGVGGTNEDYLIIRRALLRRRRGPQSLTEELDSPQLHAVYRVW